MTAPTLANERECAAVGLDAERVGRLARRLAACGAEAGALRLTIFGGSGGGTLRRGLSDGPPYIVASIAGPHVWDGGDGAEHVDGDGLLRGEGQ